MKAVIAIDSNSWGEHSYEQEVIMIQISLIREFGDIWTFVNHPPTLGNAPRADLYVIDFGGLTVGYGSGATTQGEQCTRQLMKAIEDRPGALFLIWSSFTQQWYKDMIREELENNNMSGETKMPDNVILYDDLMGVRSTEEGWNRARAWLGITDSVRTEEENDKIMALYAKANELLKLDNMLKDVDDSLEESPIRPEESNRYVIEEEIKEEPIVEEEIIKEEEPPKPEKKQQEPKAVSPELLEVVQKTHTALSGLNITNDNPAWLAFKAVDEAGKEDNASLYTAIKMAHFCLHHCQNKTPELEAVYQLIDETIGFSAIKAEEPGDTHQKVVVASNPARDKIVGYITVPVYAGWFPGRRQGFARFRFADCAADIIDDSGDEERKLGTVGGAMGGVYEILFPTVKKETNSTYTYLIRPEDFWYNMQEVHAKLSLKLEGLTYEKDER